METKGEVEEMNLSSEGTNTRVGNGIIKCGAKIMALMKATPVNESIQWKIYKKTNLTNFCISFICFIRLK
jgi:hypothetical protein